MVLFVKLSKDKFGMDLHWSFWAAVLFLCFVPNLKAASNNAQVDSLCESWDNIPSRATCRRPLTKDCTRYVCRVDFQGKSFHIFMSLLNLRDLPQVRVLLDYGENYFVQSVLQTTSFLIPNLTASGYFEEEEVRLHVTFEPQDDGILLGVSFKTTEFPQLTHTVFPVSLLQSPPTTDGTDELKRFCGKMNMVIQSIEHSPNYQCSKSITSCDEILCSARGDSEFEDHIAISIDSCSHPIYVRIAVRMKQISVDKSTVFYHSGTHFIRNFYEGDSLKVEFLMRVTNDTQSFSGSVHFIHCYAQYGCSHVNNFVIDAYLPIPACRVAPDQNNKPLIPANGDSEECSSWSQIKSFAENSLSRDCTVLPNCNGLKCSSVSSSIPLPLTKCQDPVFVNWNLFRVVLNHTMTVFDFPRFSNQRESVILKMEEISPTLSVIGAVINTIAGNYTVFPDTGMTSGPCGDQTYEVTSTYKRKEKLGSIKTNNDKTPTHRPPLFSVVAAIASLLLVILTLIAVAVVLKRRRHIVDTEMVIKYSDFSSET